MPVFFVGEFEKMYQEFDDPWNQTKEGYVENSISRQVVCNYINQYQINSIRWTASECQAS